MNNSGFQYLSKQKITDKNCEFGEVYKFYGQYDSFYTQNGEYERGWLGFGLRKGRAKYGAYLMCQLQLSNDITESIKWIPYPYDLLMDVLRGTLHDESGLIEISNGENGYAILKSRNGDCGNALIGIIDRNWADILNYIGKYLIFWYIYRDKIMSFAALNDVCNALENAYQNGSSFCQIESEVNTHIQKMKSLKNDLAKIDIEETETAEKCADSLNRLSEMGIEVEI